MARKKRVVETIRGKGFDICGIGCPANFNREEREICNRANRCCKFKYEFYSRWLMMQLRIERKKNEKTED